MKLFRDELIPLNILVIILIAAIFFSPLDAIRLILGFPFLLLFPGYTLLKAIFPGKNMGLMERIILSLVMSVAMVSLIGLILDYTPWGIHLETILITVTLFIFITSAIAWIRLRRIPKTQEQAPASPKPAVKSWFGTSWNKALSIILILATVVTAGALGYAIASPKGGESFTEFYVLGPEGRAADYPVSLALGESGTVILGIINQETEATNYRVEIRLEDALIDKIGPISLEQKEKWEETVTFTPTRAGDDQKLELFLYKSDKPEPLMKPHHFWIDVSL